MATSYPPILDRLGKGPPVKLAGVGGGCIADSRVAAFADGSTVFVKCAAGAPGMFEREAEGLAALGEARAIRVPGVLAVGDDALVLENIEQGSGGTDFFETFGRQFARLHRRRGPACGFAHDNFIGSTQQVNQPLSGPLPDEGQGDGEDWPEFFLERRLRFQVRLAAVRGHGDKLAKLLGACEHRLVELMNTAIEPPSILHGDLWSGNFIVDKSGQPCLIDPAVYYGHREADLAMTRLFGGFSPAFYAAYHEEFPLPDGPRERLPMYQLYHLLNHLNLFGSGYYAQSERILQKYQ